MCNYVRMLNISRVLYQLNFVVARRDRLDVDSPRDYNKVKAGHLSRTDLL